MRTKRAQGQSMFSSVDMLEKARPFASALVEHQERRTGSRMAAYEGVASWVGVSSSWLRKLLGRQPVDLGAHEYLNIVHAYRSLCERIEERAAHERQLATALRGQADEAIQSALGVVDRVPGPQESGKGGAQC